MGKSYTSLNSYLNDQRAVTAELKLQLLRCGFVTCHLWLNQCGPRVPQNLPPLRGASQGWNGTERARQSG